MLPGLMLLVALTTNPAVVSAWPVSERDAALAAAEAVLRDRMAEYLKGIEYFEGQRLTYQERLKSNGVSTDQERKGVAFLARRLEDCKTELMEARDRMKEIQSLREQERRLRAEMPKEGKK